MATRKTTTLATGLQALAERLEQFEARLTKLALALELVQSALEEQSKPKGRKPKAEAQSEEKSDE